MVLRGLLRCAFVALVCSGLHVSAAAAAEVTLLSADGRVRTVQDPFVPAAPDLPVRPTRAAPPRAAAAARRPTVPGELRRLLTEGRIDQATHDEHRERYDDARKRLKRLEGARRVELGAVVRTLEDIAGRGELEPSRLPALGLTLERNLRWWTSGPLLPPGRRVGFAGSELVWQYYPGRGIQFQVLASFGKLNGLWQGKSFDDRLARLLDELLRLPAERAGGIAWEYYFALDRGRAPWVSGLAQGTAVQALARAAIRLGRKDEVIPIAQRALGIFEQPPPAGVRLAEPDGAHYLIYSFDRRLRVLNGFAQAVVGLHDFAGYANDPRARALFEAGDAVARREVPTYDTGAWSLYSRGRVANESSLSYHTLTRDFLAGLCSRTQAEPYCAARANFTAYLGQRPEVAVRSRRVRGGEVGRLRFALSKVSRVGVEVSRGGRVVLSRPAFAAGRGGRFIEWDVPRKAGSYAVRVTAVDLAGNVGSAAATIRVLAPKKRRRRS